MTLLFAYPFCNFSIKKFASFIRSSNVCSYTNSPQIFSRSSIGNIILFSDTVDISVLLRLFPSKQGSSSQAFITIRYSVRFVNYNSFVVYRMKRLRLPFTGDRSIFVSFDSTIISNLNFCSTILNTLRICTEIHCLTCIVIQSNSFDFTFSFYFFVFCFYLVCIML